ncbi:MAG: CPBP family intramembrane metalloprotease [Candidatus Methanoplasma sp.]|jgi:hypothetical protein|nr:CPBP family intramembrane metalloprotease [Candidatus Methanoplasma sp.]
MSTEETTDKCPRCDSYSIQDKAFCGSCGRRLKPEEKSFLSAVIDLDRNPLFSLAFIASILVAAILVAETLYLVAQSYDIFVSVRGMRIVFSFISPTLDFAPYCVSRNGAFNQLYWVFVMSAILTSAALVMYRFIGSLKTVTREKSYHPAEKSCFFWMGTLLCTVLAADFLYVLIIQSFGQSIDNPFGLWESFGNLYLYANAPVWEELATRAFYIGIPMTAVTLIITKKKESLKCLLGGFGMSRFALILIIVSSVIFGFAHQPVWGIYKVIPVIWFGFALGYLFVRFGLYAAIAFHFLYNYRLVFAWIGSDLLSGLIMMSVIFAGLFTAVYIIKKLKDNEGELRLLPWFISRENMADNRK